MKFAGLLRRGSASGVLVALAALTSGSPSRAESPSVRLARQLDPVQMTTRANPLADADGRIPFLAELGSGDDARSLGLVEVAPGIARGRLDVPELTRFASERPDLRLSVTPRLRTQLDKARPRSGADAFVESLAGVGAPGAGQGEGVVVGVVDTGIDITHPAFLDEEGKTRIAWLMTWGEPTGKHPELEEMYGCTDPSSAPCAIFSADDIDAILAGDATFPESVHDLVGHGTHVASIAAGNGGRGNGKPVKHVGMAPKATLVIASPSRGGGFGDADVLLGTKFIFDRAADMEMPAVVNLSLGGDFGPHDGTSLLEKATAAFVGDDKPGRAIVVAAGNSGSLFATEEIEPLGIHTEVHVEEHAPARVPIYVPAAKGGDVFVWVTFRPGDEVTVGLDGPGGSRWVNQVEPGDEAGYDTDEVQAAVVNNLVNDNSSINADTNSAVAAFYGAWDADSTFALTLEGTGDAQLWVVGQGDATQGAYFVQATKQGTINQPASHPRLLAVGCTINRDGWTALDAGALALDSFGGGPIDVDAPCYFSAAGPTPLGVPKPEISAPGGFMAAAMSEDADPRETEGSMFSGEGCPDDTQCYVVDDRYAIASGTSMSAPLVTGAAALLFEQNRELTQAQITALLQASARRPEGKVPYGSQIGAGVLDVRHALQVLATEGVGGPPPDPEQSFYFLSAESARPDPSWAVVGSVQLRRADGSIATDLDGSLLSVEVHGGLLVRPATKVSHGLFQFAVAGRRETGGQSMNVRVLYDGAPIGAVTSLPIAIDEWAADGAPRADGGWSCSASSSRASSHTSFELGACATIACLLGLAVSRRRRRAS